MPKINIDGIIREMTPEEIAEVERAASETSAQERGDIESRMSKIEAAFNKLQAKLTSKT